MSSASVLIADSSLLRDTLLRLGEALGLSASDTRAAMAAGFMASADNAHALHPNHPELYDAQNRVRMNAVYYVCYRRIKDVALIVGINLLTALCYRPLNAVLLVTDEALIMSILPLRTHRGVTLLIPYEETYNLMTKPNIKHIPSPNAASKVTSIFRKLTLASGATINVSGNICIGGSIASCNGGSPSSFPTGSVGMLDLSRGGVINLASGSNLYAWGYVKGQDMDQGNNTAASGVGEINAASGATVWEDYQVGEWRGGTASSTIYNNKGSWKFFPFQSYSVQNIEAPVNYAYGSNCKCYWTIFGNGSVYDVNFPLIASSGSLFKLASGGTVRKWYDPTTDHVCFEMGGTAALDALTLSVMGETVTSSDYYLPIPANLKIVLKSGNNLTVSKPMTMHAGSVVDISTAEKERLKRHWKTQPSLWTVRWMSKVHISIHLRMVLTFAVTEVVRSNTLRYLPIPR